MEKSSSNLTGPFFSRLKMWAVHRGTVYSSRMMRRAVASGLSSSSVTRAITRAKAAMRSSRVIPVSSSVGGGRGYSSGSFSYICAAAFSKPCMSWAICLKRWYSSNWRIRACSGSSSSSTLGLGSSDLLFISSSVAAMAMNALASSMSRSGAFCTDWIYWSVTWETKISRMSIFALPMRNKSMSSGPSKSFKCNVSAILYPNPNTFRMAPSTCRCRKSTAVPRPLPRMLGRPRNRGRKISAMNPRETYRTVL